LSFPVLVSWFMFFHDLFLRISSFSYVCLVYLILSFVSNPLIL
jgi:hypothetical protein